MVVLLHWLGTMKLHVEDMLTPLHLRVGGSGRGVKSGREGRRQREGGIREREAEMMTKVCVCVCVCVCVYICRVCPIEYRERAVRERKEKGRAIKDENKG